MDLLFAFNIFFHTVFLRTHTALYLFHFFFFYTFFFMLEFSFSGYYLSPFQYSLKRICHQVPAPFDAKNSAVNSNSCPDLTAENHPGIKAIVLAL